MSNKSFKSFKAFRESYVDREGVYCATFFQRVFHYSGRAQYSVSYIGDDGKHHVDTYFVSDKFLTECKFDTYALMNAYIADMLAN